MKAYQITTGDRIDDVHLADLPEPNPGLGEVKVAMRAASLNYRDLGIVQGGYPRNNTRPIIPLSDGAGEIVAVGDGVTRWNVGDRVSPIFLRDWIDGRLTDSMLRTGLGGGIDGVLAEYVVLPEQSLVELPNDWSFAEAATLPCAGVTAWNALFESGNLRPGDTVLLLGTGGVSIFALQIAKAAGARVIITSSSDEKLERTRSLGADETINYRRHPEWNKQVRELTDGCGVDHIVEVGGPGTLERSMKSACVGGHIHLIGVLDSPTAKVSPMNCVFNVLSVRGIYVGSRAMHERLVDAMTANMIRPVIDQTFAFDDALDAYRALATQGHFGKITIEF